MWNRSQNNFLRFVVNRVKCGTETAQQMEQQMAQKKPYDFSRSDLRYWEQRVYLPAFKNEKGESNSGFYHVKIQAHGERRGVSLKCTALRPAAKLAKSLDDLIRLHGWTRGLAEFRGEKPKPKNTLTLGDYLEEVAATGEIKRRTLRIYITKVRTIAAAIGKPRLPEKMSKFDYVNGGAQAWQKLVDAVPIRILTSKAIYEWRKNYLEQRLGNPRKVAAATRTTNSCIRAGKAIFADDVRKLISDLSLPEPVPFSDVQLLEERSNKYHSQISSPEMLLRAGADELATATMESEFQALWLSAGGTGQAPDPAPIEKIRAERSAWRKREAFKVLVLGLCAGLRRGEIDLLLWSQVNFSKGLISITVTDIHEPKADSDGDIHLDPEIMQLLHAWKSSSECRFVVEGAEANTTSEKYHYRANRPHCELITWLKGKRITSHRPLHTLRKEFGAIICEQAGIYAASKLLRHANISMTAAVYADHKKKVTSNLGSAFS